MTGPTRLAIGLTFLAVFFVIGFLWQGSDSEPHTLTLSSESQLSQVTTSAWEDLWCDIRSFFFSPCPVPAPTTEVVANDSAGTVVSNAPAVSTTTIVQYVTNEYVTNPTETVREVVTMEGGGYIDTSNFITREEYDNQVDALLTSIENMDTGSGGSGGGLSDITGESIEELSDVVTMTKTTGDLFTWNGTAWTNIATSSLGITGGGLSLFTDGGVTTYLNSLSDNLAIGGTSTSAKLSVQGSGSDLEALAGIYDSSSVYESVLSFDGDYVYAQNGNGEFQIIDVSDPENPVEAAVYASGSFWLDDFLLSSNGDYLYAENGNSELEIIDVSDPENPVEVSTYASDSGFVNISLLSSDGNYLYAENNDGELEIINISDPQNPVEAATYASNFFSIGGFLLSADGNYLYAENGNSDLEIIDVSDPQNPVVESIYTSDSFTVYNFLLSTNGDYIYATNNNGSLEIINVSDPENPVEVSTYTSLSGGFNSPYFTVGNQIFLFNHNSKLEIVDVSDPENPTEISTYTSDSGWVGGSFAVSLDGDYLYVENNDSNLEIINISDPENPIEVAIYVPSTYLENIRFQSGNYLFIENANDNLEIIYVPIVINPAAGGTSALFSGGNVGIGKQSPLSKLDVNGSFALSGSNRYINFNANVAGVGGAGYGIRDNQGVLELKHDSGNWKPVLSGQFSTTGVLPVTASDGSLASSGVFGNAGNLFLPSGSGQVIGRTTFLSIDGITPRFQMLGTDSSSAGSTVFIGAFNSTDSVAGNLTLYKSGNGSVGSATVVNSNEALGALTWRGAQQTGTFSNSNVAASIAAFVDGTVTSGASADMPGRLVFSTTPDGSGTLAERMRITSSGNIGVGTSTPRSKLTVYGDLLLEGASRYLNFGTATGTSGYGLRDNAGTLEYKHATGDWEELGAGGGSTLGTEWATTTAAGNDDSWNSITYGNGLFVAVGDSGGGDRVMYSQDGVNWATTTAAGNNDSWHSITYGNGLFVAVGSSGDRVMTSPDGINWTARSAADNNDQWLGVTYGNNRFVAVGNSGDRAMYSFDGVTWATTTAAGNNDSWHSITYGNGLFVAVGSSGDRVMTSPDGINWTARNAADNNDDWNSITYGNGLFVAVGWGTTDLIMTSPDGINWTGRSSLWTHNWRAVTYGNGLFVAVGCAGGSGLCLIGDGETRRITTSPDGVNWTLRDSITDLVEWRSITYGNGQFVAVAPHAGFYPGFNDTLVITSGKTEISPLAHNNLYQGGLNIMGNVGIGTTTGSAKLHIIGTAGNTNALTVASSTGSSMLTIDATGNATFVGSGGTCTINGSGACSSDERLKTNFRALDNHSALDNLMTLRVGTYQWADTTWDQSENIGVLAQDLLAVYPQLVGQASTTFMGVTDTYYTVNYAGLTVPIIAAIKELNLKLEDIATTTPLSDLSPDSFANQFFNRLIAWFADAANGIGTMVANTFLGSELCLQDEEGVTCYTRADLDAVVDGSIEEPEDDEDSPVDNREDQTPLIDICPNIEGGQAELPSGYLLDENGECVEEEPAEEETVPVLGCMDSTAENYDSAATKDDGSCTYESDDEAGSEGESDGEETVVEAPTNPSS